MDQSKYFVKEKVMDYGKIVVTYTEKERKCEFCNITHSTKKMDVLYYRDKDDNRRSKELCQYCYKELNKLTK